MQQAKRKQTNKISVGFRNKTFFEITEMTKGVCVSVCPRGGGDYSSLWPKVPSPASGPRPFSGGWVPQSLVPGPFSSLWSQVPPGGWESGGEGYPSQVLGQGYPLSSSPFPSQDQDGTTPPLPSFLDNTRHGQDTQQAVRLLRSGRRTFLL